MKRGSDDVAESEIPQHLVGTGMEALLVAIDRLHPPKHARLSIHDLVECDSESVSSGCSRKTHTPPPVDVPATSTTTLVMTCWHARIAQKSYGVEKRFLCPPPQVSFDKPPHSLPAGSLRMSVWSDDDTGSPCSTEQLRLRDSSISPFWFRQLHVSSSATAKNKSFTLGLHLVSPFSPGMAVRSQPITVISKPSKKTNKCRNASLALRSGDTISLYSRINSQTVRTRFVTASNERGWSANQRRWDALVIRAVDDDGSVSATLSDSSSTLGSLDAPIIRYGMKVVLSHPMYPHLRSPIMIIRKVDRNEVAKCTPGATSGDVSQMHRIVFENPHNGHMYWGSIPLDDATPSITASYGSANDLDGEIINQVGWITATDHHSLLQYKVPDHLCWTIVGVTSFSTPL